MVQLAEEIKTLKESGVITTNEMAGFSVGWQRKTQHVKAIAEQLAGFEAYIQFPDAAKNFNQLIKELLK